MKNYKNKISELLSQDIKNYNPENINAYDLVYNYLIMYENESNHQKSKDVSEVLKKALNINYNGILTLQANKRVLASLINLDDQEKIDIVFNAQKLSNIFIESYEDYGLNYRDGDLDMYKNILSNEVADYIISNDTFIKNFDRSNESINAINANLCLYIVDDEVIIFLPDTTYISITMSDGKLIFNDHNAEIMFRAALADKKETFLKNIYVNINDIPHFLRDKIQEIRNKQLSNIANITTNNKQLIRNLFKRK